MTTNQDAYKKVCLVGFSFLLVVYKMNNTYLTVVSILESIRYKVLKNKRRHYFSMRPLADFAWIFSKRP